MKHAKHRSKDEIIVHILKIVNSEMLRYYAKELHMSFTTINDIIKRDRQQKEKEKEQEEKQQQQQQREIKSNIDNGNGDGKVEQQQQIISTSLSLPSLSAAELEELSDRQKAAIAYKLYEMDRRIVHKENNNT
jgi:DNA primase